MRGIRAHVVLGGILLIVVPFVVFTAALPWANSTRQREVAGPARALRLTAVYLALGGLCAIAALGLFSRSIALPLTALGMWAMSLMTAVLMMRDGGLLARARPLDRWETRSLIWLLGASVLAGVGVFVDAAVAANNSPAVSVVVAALIVPIVGGVIAVIAMLRA